MTKKLTAKQSLFVDYYCEYLDGRKAAELAGYKGSYNTLAVTAHNNLRRPHIAAVIAARFAASAMTTDEALTRLGEMARADLADFVTLDENVIKIDWDKAKGKTHLIKSIKHTMYGLSIELHDPQSAIEKILKAGGAYVQRIDLKGDLSVSVNWDESDAN